MRGKRRLTLGVGVLVLTATAAFGTGASTVLAAADSAKSGVWRKNSRLNSSLSPQVTFHSPWSQTCCAPLRIRTDVSARQLGRQ